MGTIVRIFYAPLTSYETMYFLSHISNNFIIESHHKKIE